MATVVDNCSTNICPELLPQLQKILPTTTNYKVVDLKKWNETGFTSTLRTTISTKDDAVEWVKLFERTSLTTYRVDRTYRENSQRLTFKKLYHCHQNTKPRSHGVKNPHPKHVNCNSKLTITIKQKHMRRSKDPYLKEYPCEIYLRYNHNHPIETPDVLKFRRPTDGVRKIFLTLYENGHTPISALKKHKINLIKKYGESGGPTNILADRAFCPNAKWCYDLYRNVYKKEKMALKSEEILQPKFETIIRLGDEMNIQENVIVKEGFNFTELPNVNEMIKVIEASPQNVLDVENELASCFDSLKQKIEANPNVYFDPVRSFIQKFQVAAASDDNFIPFLNSFGNGLETVIVNESQTQCDKVEKFRSIEGVINNEVLVCDVSEHGYSKKTDNNMLHSNETILILSDGSSIPITNIPVYQYVSADVEADPGVIIC